MKEVIAKFINEKGKIDQSTGQPFSKLKRLDSMYDIVKNKFYKKNWTKSDRLMAIEFMREIINED